MDKNDALPATGNPVSAREAEEIEQTPLAEQHELALIFQAKTFAMNNLVVQQPGLSNSIRPRPGCRFAHEIPLCQRIPDC